MMNRNIVIVAGFIMAAFFINIVYMTYLQVYRSEELLHHPRNRRLQLLEEKILRGKIIDRRDRILAETTVSGEGVRRVYPYGEITGNVTGYLSRKLGRWGLEAVYNNELLGIDSGLAADGSWALSMFDKGKPGNNIILSLDAELQKTAYNMLGNRKGAVVAIEPGTGRILVMVSKPGFDPGQIETQWESLRVHPDSPLLNRAVQGLYPPGSTMKVVTAAGILAEKPETASRTFDAPGYIVVEGRRIEDSQARGKLSLAEAMARSSNYVFALLGIELGAAKFVDTAHGFGIGEELSLGIPAASSRIPEPEEMSELELAETAIGQGRILVTPLNMAIVAAAVANGGRVMKPNLVDEVRSPGGVVIRSFKTKQLLTPMSEETADIIRDLMVSVVTGGTGRAASISGHQVAGKTGSAENPHGRPHAWFIGFAPVENPKVAVAVIVENGGAGGTEAAPIAREIMKKVISR
ncbi:peptidoglycan D,D-transpeptidase FtsI family protein [Phosphitispora sp. TUW77]|uniref:peptidoglycan D,D-transpeptidase FtsI family protein n=1 Tax=Phosphitispora sp. TUW77 TaxID=3152361 RepID=UPI003AB5A94C